MNLCWKFFCYRDSLIIDIKMKRQVEKECYSLEIYSLKDFPQVYNNAMNA